MQVTPACSATSRTILKDQDVGILGAVSDPRYNTNPIRTGCAAFKDSYLVQRGTRVQEASIDLSGSQGLNSGLDDLCILYAAMGDINCLPPSTARLLCLSDAVQCQRVTERVSKATATKPLDSRFPAAASYSRQYLADGGSTGSYAEFEITKLANHTVKYQSDHIFAGQVRMAHCAWIRTPQSHRT